MDNTSPEQGNKDRVTKGKDLLGEVKEKLGVSPEVWEKMETEEKSLLRLWGVYLLYKDVLKRADLKEVRSLVSDLGYRTQIVEMGFKFRDPFLNQTEIGVSNSIRVGEKGVLYVGMRDGQSYHRQELSHDLGAILLGYWEYQKMPDPKTWTKDHIVDINLIRAKGATADTRGLDRIEEALALGAGEFFPGEARLVVSTTHLLDAMVDGLVNPDVIKIAAQTVTSDRT